jgi:hypothetical protein
MALPGAALDSLAQTFERVRPPRTNSTFSEDEDEGAAAGLGSSMGSVTGSAPGSLAGSARKDTVERPMCAHVVGPNESLTGIAVRYGMSVAELRRLNHMGGGDVFAGQKLTVYGVADVDSETSQVAAEERRQRAREAAMLGIDSAKIRRDSVDAGLSTAPYRRAGAPAPLNLGASAASAGVGGAAGGGGLSGGGGGPTVSSALGPYRTPDRRTSGDGSVEPVSPRGSFADPLAASMPEFGQPSSRAAGSSRGGSNPGSRTGSRAVSPVSAALSSLHASPEGRPADAPAQDAEEPVPDLPGYRLLKAMVRMEAKEGLVCGMLTVTPTWVVFEPDQAEPLVGTFGCLRFQFTSDIEDLLEVFLASQLATLGIETKVPAVTAAAARHPMFDPQLPLDAIRFTVATRGGGKADKAEPVHVAFHGTAKDLTEVRTVLTFHIRRMENRKRAEKELKAKQKQKEMEKREREKERERERAEREKEKGGAAAGEEIALAPIADSSAAAAAAVAAADPAADGAGSTAADAAITSSSSTSQPVKSRIVIGAAFPPLTDCHTIAVPHLSSSAAAAASASASAAAPAAPVPEKFVPVVEAVLDSPSCFLSQEQIDQLAGALPMRYQERTWARLYSSQSDGISLRTLYRCAADMRVTLLVINTGSCVLGAFATETWKVNPKAFGTGESFLFTLAHGPLRTYHASGDNTFYQLANDNFLAMGGGGKYGLYIDEGLESGTSGACVTYASEPLSGTDEDFKVLHVEVWGLGK